MKLNEIRSSPGSNKKAKRRGRGIGSGRGKTSGKGHKGAKARTGTTTRAGFEGGQMQLIRRLPKRGFTSPFKVVFQAVNLEFLNGFAAHSVIGPTEMKMAGLISSVKEPVKILGEGDLKKSLTIRANAFSESAKKKIAAAGAKCEYIARLVAART